MQSYRYSWIFLFSFWGNTLIAQQSNAQVIPSIQEFIFPGQPEIKNNFNLFYEVHLNQKTIPQPSFWYKIIFSKDCDFEFTLFPLMETDHYEFYLYRVAGNTDFCQAIADDRVTSLNDYKFQKKYDDNEQSADFRASLVHVKPIPVKAGDAIYLEVLATKGKDCGHIFDCRTSESSLVTKIINDNCDAIPPIYADTAQVLKERREAVALRYLSDLFCIERKAPIAFTAINLSGKTRTVKQQNDFLDYSRTEEIHNQQHPKTPVDSAPKQVEIEIVKASSPEPKKEITPPSILKKVLAERARITDSLEQVASEKIKSTADLNLLTEQNQHQTLYDANGEQKATRLEVDKALFSILLADLQNRQTLKREEIKESYIRFRKINKKEAAKRRQASKKLKQLKAEKKLIEADITATQSKIKNIERFIAQKKYAIQENFVFNQSSANPEDEVIYKIQIGVYKNKISPDIFYGLSPVSEDPYEGGVRYSVGAFPKFDYAKQAKAHVVEVGLKDAFIVAYFRGKRIGIQDALQLER